jgi:hypothetical protein
VSGGSSVNPGGTIRSSPSRVTTPPLPSLVVSEFGGTTTVPTMVKSAPPPDTAEIDAWTLDPSRL